MASFRKLPSGLWQATVSLPDKKRITRTDPLKKVVTAWAAETEAQVRRGKWKDPRVLSMTVGQWHSKWLTTRTVEESTAEGNERSWRLHLKKTFENRPVADVTKLEVEAWVVERTKAGAGPAAVLLALIYLRTILNAAVDHELIDRNVAKHVEPPVRLEKPPEWFTPEEVEEILAVMQRKKWVSMAVMTEVMVWCGLRWGEAAALTGADIDFERNKIMVSHTLLQSGKPKAYPKNSPSVGEVPVPPRVLQAVKGLLEGRDSRGRIFVSRGAGKNLIGTNWRTDWKDILEDAGVPHKSPHKCRHTCASWLVQAGVPMREVQRLLRHGSSETTEGYAHLSPDRHEAVTDAWAIFESRSAPDAHEEV